MKLAARNARKIRAGILFYELTQQNPLLIVHAREVLTAIGYEAFVRLMVKDGATRPAGLPPI